MGFLDRMRSVGKGVKDALIDAPLGVIQDMVANDPYESVASGNYSDSGWRIKPSDYRMGAGADSLKQRAGDAVGGLFGPDRGLGAAIGGLPEGVRAPGRKVLTPIFDGAEWVYREGIAEPLSTVATATSLSESETHGGSFFDKRTWTDAYDIAQDRSPGQAIALAFTTKDVLNEQELAAAQESGAYKVISGTLDAVLRLRLDPTVVAGKGAMAARSRYLVRPIDAATDIDKVMRSREIRKFNDRVQKIVDEGGDGAAARIRDEMFPHHEHGAQVASILADAPTPSARQAALRGLLGDLDEIDRVGRESAATANAIRRLLDDKNAVSAILDDFGDGYTSLPGAGLADELTRLEAELDELYPQAARLARREAAASALDAVPRTRAADRLRTGITRSDFYQKSPLSAPLRTVFHMMPHHLLKLEEVNGDIQVSRMLDESDLPQIDRDLLRSEFQRARDASERQQAYLRAEAAAVRSIAEQAGMTVDDIDDILRNAEAGRAKTAAVLKSRAYDGEGRSVVHLRGDGIPTDYPLMVSQTENVLPIVDLALVRKAADPIKRLRLEDPKANIPKELLVDFYKVWKPSVLLRVGWPIRVVGDEQLRMMALIGALAPLKHGVRGIRNLREDVKTQGRGYRPGRTPRGTRNLEVNGYAMSGAFTGGLDGGPNIHQNLVSARAAFDQFFGRNEQGILKKLRANTNQWKSHMDAENPSYGAAWEHAVNKQIGSDDMARKILQGESDGDIASWLRSTAEGQRYAARLPFRRDYDAWVKSLREQVDSYLPTPDLQAKALRRKATAKDLADTIPSAAHRPLIHGEILAQTLGTSGTLQTLRKFTDTMYHAFGSMPTDILSRSQFFDDIYMSEVRRQVGLLDAQASKAGRRLTQTELERVEGLARTKALVHTRRYLYDLAEQSRLADMVKFVAPFYPAWQEVLTVWAGIAVENPAFIARMRQAWLAPERSGLFKEDEDGRSYIRLRLPEWAKENVPGLKAVDSINLSRESMNMILSGPPGFGPMVQLPVNAIIRDRPDLAETDLARMIMPYGPQGWRDMLIPATAKRAYSLNKKEEDRVYANTLLRIYQTKAVDYELGKRKTKPTWEEAKEETDAHFRLRLIASYISPAAVSFDSPYQMQIDAYRQLRDEDPETALDRFIEEYGEEYIALTVALTETNDGIPATVEGYKARKKYQPLIEKHPDLGGLIVGSEGAGEFSAAVYDYQLRSSVRPGSSENQRDPRSFEDVQRAPEVVAGWKHYRKIMDLLTMERVKRGLPSLNVKEARDLRAAKKAAVEALTEKYPGWAEEFGVTDRNKWTRKLAGLRDIADAPVLRNRPDIRGLQEYLRLRTLFRQELESRTHKTLEARTNMDLAKAWDAATAALVERNLAFSDLYFRHLESDPMDVD